MQHIQPFAKEEYALLHFSLIPSEQGKLAQRTSACGVYRTIEEAFSAARRMASDEWQRLRNQATEQGNAGETWHVIDTEFGYDLKRNFLVVSRFWIHAKAISET